MRLKIDGAEIEISVDTMSFGPEGDVHVHVLRIGELLSSAVREHDRVFAHRQAWRARAIMAVSESHKAWPEWKVKSHVESDPEWLRVSEAVIASAFNVTILESLRDSMLARIGYAVSSPSRISPAFPISTR